MIKTSVGLANAGRTNAKGMPGLLQLAVMASEFRDTVVFSSPPPPVQRILFAVLAPLGRSRGLRAIYPEFDAPHHREEPSSELLELIETSAPRPDSRAAVR